MTPGRCLAGTWASTFQRSLRQHQVSLEPPRVLDVLYAAIDGAIRRWRHLHDILAAAARVARPPGDPDPQLRRGDIELFGAQLADRMQDVAAAGAIATPDVDHHLVARQVRR